MSGKISLGDLHKSISQQTKSVDAHKDILIEIKNSIIEQMTELKNSITAQTIELKKELKALQKTRLSQSYMSVDQR